MNISPLACLALALAVLLSGCYTTANGYKKTGIPRKDSIESRYEKSTGDLFQAAEAVLGRMGTINDRDPVNLSLVAKVDTSTVYAKVEALGANDTRIIIQCRRGRGRGDLDLCREIDKQILLHLVVN